MKMKLSVLSIGSITDLQVVESNLNLKLRKNKMLPKQKLNPNMIRERISEFQEEITSKF